MLNKFFIALALVAAPLQAQSLDYSQLNPVMEVAKGMCPAAMEVARQTKDYKGTAAALVAAAEKRGMSKAEVLLLLDFCVIYTKGYIDGTGLDTGVHAASLPGNGSTLLNRP